MIKPYYEDNHIRIFNKDCRDMSDLPDESVDLIVTDPPYQLSTIERFRKPDSGEKWNVKSGVYHRVSKGFMGKEWDVLPPVEVWQESLRVLKPGAFAFIMTTPRQDSLCQILSDLAYAGFQMSFSSIYWTYASGFPKAQNIGKAVDKRLGAEREVIGKHPDPRHKYPNTDITGGNYMSSTPAVRESGILTAPATLQAKALDGSYGGFQPKPAVEVILVAMKPLSEKTFIEQALKNRKGITWLDDCRVPYESEADKSQATPQGRCTGQVYDSMLGRERKEFDRPEQKGRFPANLLVSDDVLNDGQITKSGNDAVRRQEGMFVEHHLGGVGNLQVFHPDSGSFSRYFDLDKWWAKTFPFLIVPKASKSEKDRLLDVPRVVKSGLPLRDGSGDYVENVAGDGSQSTRRTKAKNVHPTVKPVKLMSYLITLGSREGDVVLDNFGGSGTTGVAANLLNRKCVMYEIDEQYCEMATNRCRQQVLGL